MQTFSEATPVRHTFSVRQVILASVFLVGTGCVPAQPPPPLPSQVQDRPFLGEQVPLITLMLWHTRDLALTPEQIRSLGALRSEFQRTADPQTAEIQRLELELQRLLSREQIDVAQVETRIRRVEAL